MAAVVVGAVAVGVAVVATDGGAVGGGTPAAAAAGGEVGGGGAAPEAAMVTQGTRGEEGVCMRGGERGAGQGSGGLVRRRDAPKILRGQVDPAGPPTTSSLS